jgi:hypothetical protein
MVSDSGASRASREKDPSLSAEDHPVEGRVSPQAVIASVSETTTIPEGEKIDGTPSLEIEGFMPTLLEPGAFRVTEETPGDHSSGFNDSHDRRRIGQEVCRSGERRGALP